MRILAFTYRFERKLQDCWIGAYWEKKPGEYANRLDVWICLLPMLPFHLAVMYHDAKRQKAS